jgi:uroporphyrinogen-III decarboxylase
MGSELALIGNLDNLSLSGATVDEVYAMSMACLRAGAPSGRYILANAGADIPLSTPPENLRAMLAASRAYSVETGSGP